MTVSRKQPKKMDFRNKLIIFAPCCSTGKVGRALLRFVKQKKSRISPTEHRVTFWAETAWAQTGMKYCSEEYKIML